jgi:hypothetical protein
MIGHNQRPRAPSGGPIARGAFLADFERSRQPKPKPAPLSLTDEICELMKTHGHGRLSALRQLREYAASPIRMDIGPAAIQDARLRVLVERYLATGGLI